MLGLSEGIIDDVGDDDSDMLGMVDGVKEEDGLSEGDVDIDGYDDVDGANVGQPYPNSSDVSNEPKSPPSITVLLSNEIL